MIRRNLTQVILPSLCQNLNEPEMLALAYLLLIEAGSDFNGVGVKFDAVQRQALAEALEEFVYKDPSSFVLLGEDDRETREDAATRTVQRMENTVVVALRRMKTEFKLGYASEKFTVEEAAPADHFDEPAPAQPIADPRNRIRTPTPPPPTNGVMRLPPMWVDEQVRNEARFADIIEQARLAGLPPETVARLMTHNTRLLTRLEPPAIGE